MGKAFDKSHSEDGKSARHHIDWRRGMSNNVATALIVYTALQIFVTVHAMAKGLPSITPYIALVILVAAIIPACRWFERRWLGLSDEQAADPTMKSAYRRDQILLWVLAIGLPLLLTAFFDAVFSAVG